MERLREEEGLIARFEKCLRLERNWLTCNAKIGEGRDMCKKLEDMTKNCFSPLVAPEQYQAVLDCGMVLFSFTTIPIHLAMIKLLIG
jgi:hypothetical protein